MDLFVSSPKSCNNKETKEEKKKIHKPQAIHHKRASENEENNAHPPLFYPLFCSEQIYEKIV